MTMLLKKLFAQQRQNQYREQRESSQSSSSRHFFDGLQHGEPALRDAVDLDVDPRDVVAYVGEGDEVVESDLTVARGRADVFDEGAFEDPRQHVLADQRRP